MKKNTISTESNNTNKPPYFSLEQYAYLKRVFRSKTITPDMSLAQIQYDAGTTAVVNQVKQLVNVEIPRDLL